MPPWSTIQTIAFRRSVSIVPHQIQSSIIQQQSNRRLRSGIGPYCIPELCQRHCKQYVFHLRQFSSEAHSTTIFLEPLHFQFMAFFYFGRERCKNCCSLLLEDLCFQNERQDADVTKQASTLYLTFQRNETITVHGSILDIFLDLSAVKSAKNTFRFLLHRKCYKY